MTVPQVSALPTPPSRDDAANFSARADAFLGDMPTMATEMNAVATFVNDQAAAAAASAASAVNAPGSNGTSTTSMTIGMGDQPLNIQTGKAFVKGQWVQLAYNADVTKYMIGEIKSYDGVTGALVVTVVRTNGAGTYADWVVSLGGAVLSDATPRNLAAGSTVKDQTAVDRPIGYRGLPKKSISTAYTVTIADVGWCLELKAGASIILPKNSTLAAGSQFSAHDSTIVLQDVSGSTKSISPASGATLYDVNTANTGARTLKARGRAVIDLSNELADTWYAGGAMT